LLASTTWVLRPVAGSVTAEDEDRLPRGGHGQSLGQDLGAVAVGRSGVVDVENQLGNRDGDRVAARTGRVGQGIREGVGPGEAVGRNVAKASVCVQADRPPRAVRLFTETVSPELPSSKPPAAVTLSDHRQDPCSFWRWPWVRRSHRLFSYRLRSSPSADRNQGLIREPLAVTSSPAAITLGPSSRFAGELRLPGSKSLSNRLLLLAALSCERTRLDGFLESDDTAHLKAALRTLGWSIEGQTSVEIAPERPMPFEARLYLGNAGTAVRPLTAVLTTFLGHFVIEGEPRMHERPIGPLVETLRQLGARIEELGQPGFPPLRIHGGELPGGQASIDATLSSQFITAVLMAAPRATSAVELTTVGDEVSLSYVEMTVRQLALFGVEVTRPKARTYRIEPQTYRSPGHLRVEGDATSASYFLGAAAVAGGPVTVLGAGRDSCQGEIGFAAVLQQMGARVEWGPDWVKVERDQLRGTDLDLRDLPDAAMTLAAVALFAEGSTTIRGVANWRVKETDRQAALIAELTKLGAEVEALPDGIRIHPPVELKSAQLETYGDHRMAMSMALASLGPVPQTILDPGCVAKTFPDFFEHWAGLAR
jgi:3-phosphoshikimate 1-carboxyvinyltransferase